ncbi:MAG: Uma2 family endonuclease [Acidobacteriota bacterium]|nr:Uma2 family endonuclease [Acidobacteriota bacterium]MDQ5837361.1 Uma2 family endonuclease [Acidobacteriota bacterium]
MSTTTRLITADELLTMPTYVNGSDRRYELIRGELKVISPTKPLHGIVRARIAAALINLVEANELGMAFGAETGFVVERDPDTVLGVDASFVSREKLATVENWDKFFPFAPDLAVEVLSPGNIVKEIDEKVAFYFAAGSRAVWVINPKRRTATVYTSPSEFRTLGGQDTLDGGDVLPGFSLELSKLFAGLK